MKYEIINNINKGYFRLVKRNNVGEDIEYYLDKFNVDLNDYWILKSSNKFRFINKEEIEKWASVICFKKDVYDKEHIDKWLDFHNSFDYQLKYLVKPFPPIEILNKIKLVEDEVYYNKQY